MSARFATPGDLRARAMATAAALRAAGLGEAAAILEAGAGYVTSSGWEWLGELGAAAAKVEKLAVPAALRADVRAIRQAARSRRPYR